MYQVQFQVWRILQVNVVSIHTYNAYSEMSVIIFTVNSVLYCLLGRVSAMEEIKVGYVIQECRAILVL